MPPLRGQATGIALALLAGLALALNAWLAVSNVRRMSHAAARVSHSHRVLETVQATLSSLQDAETGQRGFLITGEPSYLEPYEAGLKAVRQHLADASHLTHDNPEQQRRLDSMRAPVVGKLEEMDRTIRLRRSQGFEAAREVVRTDEGKRVMDGLRATVAEVTAHENQLLGERRRDSAAAARTAVATTLIGFGANLALLLAAVVTLRRRVLERERATAEIHAEKERFRTTLSSIGDAVVVTDVHGRITLLNPTAHEILGWDASAIGQQIENVFRIVNEGTGQTVESPVLKVLREGQIVGLANHTLLIRRDGSMVPIDDSGAPVRDARGEMIGVVLVFRDIGERRAAERELERRAELLKQQDRRKDEFLAVLSHELRNPLAPIRTAVAVMQRVDLTHEHAQRARDVIERQVKQMTRLVDDLLDVARITEGKIRLSTEPLDLGAAVRRTVDDHRGRFEEAKVRLELRDSDAALWLEADATRVRQVVENLLENALKFTNAGGLVVVELANSGAHAVVRVRDDGAGMDQATLARIFEPFMQAESTLARAQGGLGLGLALIKNLVELHGGSVSASSAGVGQGTEFSVVLPLARSGARP